MASATTAVLSEEAHGSAECFCGQCPQEIGESRHRLEGLVKDEMQKNSMALLDTMASQEGLAFPTVAMSQQMHERNRVIAQVMTRPEGYEPGKREAEVQRLNHAFLVQIEVIARQSNSNSSMDQEVTEDTWDPGGDQYSLEDAEGADLLLIVSLLSLGTLILPLSVALLAYVMCCRKGSKVMATETTLHSATEVSADADALSHVNDSLAVAVGQPALATSYVSAVVRSHASSTSSGVTPCNAAVFIATWTILEGDEKPVTLILM